MQKQVNYFIERQDDSNRSYRPVWPNFIFFTHIIHKTDLKFTAELNTAGYPTWQVVAPHDEKQQAIKTIQWFWQLKHI